jgi:hypothetical protein
MVAKESIRKTAEQTVMTGGGDINTVNHTCRGAVVVKDQGHKHKEKTGEMEHDTEKTLIAEHCNDMCSHIF